MPYFSPSTTPVAKKMNEPGWNSLMALAGLNGQEMLEILRPNLIGILFGIQDRTLALPDGKRRFNDLCDAVKN
jgi:hypothetical protein